ncbi:MAG: hypothetical protein Fur0042_25890 [Cyanophyceae cyanobacterium]
MSISLVVSLVLLMASVVAYRWMGRVSPGDEVPKILLAVAGGICAACAFFSTPTLLQIGAAGGLLALSQILLLDSYGL